MKSISTAACGFVTSMSIFLFSTVAIADSDKWTPGATGTVNVNAELNVTDDAGKSWCTGQNSTFTVSKVGTIDVTIVITKKIACNQAGTEVAEGTAYSAKLNDLTSLSKKTLVKAAAATGEDSGKDFFKDWGVGLAVIRGSKASISDATIVNNTVRVNSQSNNEAALLVARHFYPFKGRDCSKGTARSATQYLGDCLGGMIGVGLGSSSGGGGSQVINFVGIGLTLGGGIDTDKTTQWNLGYGFGRKFNVKVLGDGFTKDAAPPPGETQIRTKTVDMNAQFLFFTIHW